MFARLSPFRKQLFIGFLIGLLIGIFILAG